MAATKGKRVAMWAGGLVLAVLVAAGLTPSTPASALPESASGESSDEIRLMGQLKSGDLSEREDATRALAAMGSLRCIPSLIELYEKEEHRPQSATAKDYIGHVRSALLSIIRQKGPAVVFPLVEIVKSGRMELKEHALEFLGELGPEAAEAIPVIENLLERKDLDSVVRVRSAEALFEIGAEKGKYYPVLMAGCSDPDDCHGRSRACSTIQRMGRAGLQAVPALITCLEITEHTGCRSSMIAAEVLRDLGAVQPVMELAIRSRGEVRATAASILGDLRAEKGIPALMLCLEDKDHDVFVAAAEALGKIGKKAHAAIPTLIRRLKERDADDKDAYDLGARYRRVDDQVKVLDALSYIGSGERELLAFLIRSLKDPDHWIRSGAARALGRMGPAAASAIEDLKKVAAEDHERYAPERYVRGWASWALVKIRSEGADALAEEMIEWLEEADIRWYAIGILKELGPAAKKAVPSLVSIAAYKLPPSCAWDDNQDLASSVLSKIGLDAEEAQPFLQGLKDVEPRHRRKTLVMLGTIGPAAKATVGAVVESLEDPDPKVRAEAAKTLGKIGPDARAAIPALKQALGARDKETRYQARKALEILEASSPRGVTPSPGRG